ncbi:hypothetical protein ACFSTA_04025 [Ornithinibacillus salinisoli]|uniref:Uncharacterized protein n=1 Tax=Ornithinibacillus salinisoli TaxID=1848459 RepID=A0ABW4VWG6_9BACI
MDRRKKLLEKRLKQVEVKNSTLYAQVKELRKELDITIEKVMGLSSMNHSSSSTDKLDYLQEVNEQMFQQNLRLRNLIEKCIEENVVPTHEKYYDALKEVNT